MNLKYGFLPLAAMASAALPEVNFVALAEPQISDDDYLMSGLLDAKDNRWMVICPRHKKSGVQLETQAAVMLALSEYSSRLSFTMPRPAGFARFHENARALVHPAIPGTIIDESMLVFPGAFSVSIGKSLSSLHDLPKAAADKASLPIYTSDEVRERWLLKLRLSQKHAKIPTSLITRWEDCLNDTDVWHFNAGFVHGGLSCNAIYTDGTQLTGLTGLALCHYGDPALDLAWISANSSNEFMSDVLKHYQRADFVGDKHLNRRIEITSELVLLDWLLHGVDTGDEGIINDAQGLIDELYQTLLDADIIEISRLGADVSEENSDPVVTDTEHSETEQENPAEESPNVEKLFPPVDESPAPEKNSFAEIQHASANKENDNRRPDPLELSFQDRLKTTELKQTEQLNSPRE